MAENTKPVNLCSVEGCDNAALSHGKCKGCYKKEYMKKYRSSRRCSIPGCNNSYYSHNLCLKHKKMNKTAFSDPVVKVQPRPTIKAEIHPSENHVVLKLVLRKDYITCLTCDSCYDQQENPLFCQVVKKQINTKDIYGNRDQAASCTKYWPFGLTRQAMAYEKDNPPETDSGCPPKKERKWPL